jgi:non-homologous end joining protein Ku
LKTLVKRKAAGKPVKAVEPEERPDNVISLMDALKQSLKGKPSARDASGNRTSAKRSARASHRTPHRAAKKKTHRSAPSARKAG